MGMGYPMGSPMEYLNREWIPLNLPWNYPITLACHAAPWFGPGMVFHGPLRKVE